MYGCFFNIRFFKFLMLEFNGYSEGLGNGGMRGVIVL